MPPEVMLILIVRLTEELTWPERSVAETKGQVQRMLCGLLRSQNRPQACPDRCTVEIFLIQSIGSCYEIQCMQHTVAGQTRTLRESSQTWLMLHPASFY